MSNYLVIGTGVSGLSLAERLLLDGHAVVLLEKGSVGRESSWAGGGILSPLCPWDYPDEVTRLTGYSTAKYAEWTASLYRATGIDPEYEVSGMLVMPPYGLEKAMQWCSLHDVKILQQEEGLLLPEVAQVRNPRLVQALRKHVEMLGGRIIEDCEVKSIEAGDGKVSRVHSSCGIFEADSYVITAGAWSKQVLGSYAMHMEIKPVRGQMLLFKFDAPPIRHILLQDSLYLIPRRDGHLLVGSTLEDAGFDKSVTAEAKSSLWQRAQLLLPALRDMQPIQHWSGLRPGSPGNIPTIGRHPELVNLYINSGHFRYGVTMAPASAEILANAINGRPQPFDVTPYFVK